MRAARGDTSEEPIRKEAADNNDDRKAYDTASRFDDHHDAKHPDHGIRRSDGAGAQDELLVVHKNVNGGNHRKDGKCHVDRMEAPLLDPGFLRRAEKIERQIPKDKWTQRWIIASSAPKKPV